MERTVFKKGELEQEQTTKETFQQKESARRFRGCIEFPPSPLTKSFHPCAR